MTARRLDDALAAYDLARVRRADLERALCHYRRAINAHLGDALGTLPHGTSVSLLRRLRAEHAALDAELRRRAAGAAPPP